MAIAGGVAENLPHSAERGAVRGTNGDGWLLLHQSIEWAPADHMDMEKFDLRDVVLSICKLSADAYVICVNLEIEVRDKQFE